MRRGGVPLVLLTLLAAACTDDQASAPSTSVAVTTTPAATSPDTTMPATTVPATTVPATTVPATTMVVSAYFVGEERMVVVQRTVPSSVATSAAALGELLGGPTADEQALGLSTAIPAGTTLNDVSIDDAGIATVDLSPEFESGGGTLSMSLRLAQVVFTVTEFPTVTGVSFELDGVPVEVFSGEGIILDHPVDRADFNDFSPTA